MIYEIQAQFTRIDGKGNDEVIKEKYLVENAESFGDAETQGYNHCDGETGLDIVAIKRSKVREIVNKKSTTEDEKIWFADVADVRTNDDGEEVEIIYKVALYATSWDDANAKVKYLSQGFDMTILSIEKTKFAEVI